jgi:septal ring factor EnvC (AmiA/AmiB activator)
MANIKLNRLSIESFKGLKQFEFSPYGENAVIKAENGIGKTIVYDAFLWMLFDKDSNGRKAFEVRPLDRHNQPIKELVVSVEAGIEIDGIRHIFRKEQQEKLIKGQFKGYETLCWVDEVPKKVGEYQEYISEIVSEDTFKILTDLNYFNAKFKWTERRKVLLDIAGQIGTPDGFENLMAALNNRTVEKYKQVLSEQKKRHIKERDEINPRIDEILRGLEHPDIDVENLQSRRSELIDQKAGLITQQKELYSQESQRQKQIEHINSLKSKRIRREAEIKSDMTSVQNLLNEKSRTIQALSEISQKVVSAKHDATLIDFQINGKVSELRRLQGELDSYRSELKKAEAATLLTKCYACGQNLPKDSIEKNEAGRAAKIQQIEKDCKAVQKIIEKCSSEQSEYQEAKKEKQKTIDNLEAEYYAAKKVADVRIDEIHEAINNRITSPPEQDEAWQKLTAEIEQAESELGQPVSEQLEDIETQKEALQSEINFYNETLAQADRLEKDKARVKELEQQEKDLAQKIADVEKQLAEIKAYDQAYSELIESAVNGKFKYVKFKLFKYWINGDCEDCCEATYNGVPYNDLSTGQQTLTGIDIINVLSEHYGVIVPLFMDHLEALTFPIEANSQTIGLCAVKGVKKLTVEIENKVKAVA